MRLYLFEHCSICFRVRMAAALKHLHLQETVVLEDDSDTMIGLVGKRVIPILVKDDGQPMLESMDMVAYIDGLGDPILTSPQRSEVSAWADSFITKAVPLTMPRYPLLGPTGVWYNRRTRSLHRAQAQKAGRSRRAASQDP
jgi:glutaredoxin 2